MTEEEFRHRVIPLQRLMYGMALKMGMPPDEAADAVQETQIRLWRKRAGIPRNDTECRLYCIAAFRNECVSVMRRRKPTQSLEEVAEIRADDTADIVEGRDMRRRIEVMIDTLPQGQRQAIRLSGFGGLDNTEIARVTGQTEGNVRQLLSRGRRRLRELIEEKL